MRSNVLKVEINGTEEALEEPRLSGETEEQLPLSVTLQCVILATFGARGRTREGERARQREREQKEDAGFQGNRWRDGEVMF